MDVDRLHERLLVVLEERGLKVSKTENNQLNYGVTAELALAQGLVDILSIPEPQQEGTPGIRKRSYIGQPP
jgi:hypothetical protein